MVKVSSSDSLAILRKFRLAESEHVPRQIERLEHAHPSEHNTLASFTFLGRKYHILWDNQAEDDENYILNEIAKVRHGVNGKLVENPLDELFTYGMPYQAKDVYLCVEVSPTTRLDVELTRRYPQFSRNVWQKHIKDGRVNIAGKVKVSPKAQVRPDIKIDVTWPEQRDFSAETLPILYEDDDVLVIHKPAGLLTHAATALSDEFTVAEFMRSRTTFAVSTERAGIVHRLDRDTSGVMICAKHEVAAEQLKAQFSQRLVHKTYRALTSATPDKPEALIELPIARNPTAPSTFRVDANGKAAATKYKVLHATDNVAHLQLEPKTGRTHQLRVHLSYIGTPILGDRIYGGTAASRLMLHAYKLGLVLPSGETKEFIAELPDEFAS